jgi:hypothetical protein
VERTEIREVVAMELQFSVTPGRRGTLAPFSNARRRALFQDQHRRSHPPIQIYKGWQLTYDKDPIHRNRGGSRPQSPHSKSSGDWLMSARSKSTLPC